MSAATDAATWPNCKSRTNVRRREARAPWLRRGGQSQGLLWQERLRWVDYGQGRAAVSVVVMMVVPSNWLYCT
jgi:hypothetical protein